MSTALTIALSLLGSAGLFGFIQFLITRKDTHSDKLDQIITRIDETDNNISALSDKVDKNDVELREMMLQNQALVARVRILRASDEILHKMRHSKEWFDQLNEDITFYETYCKEHPKFVNNKAIHAIANINDVYAQALREGDFL